MEHILAEILASFVSPLSRCLQLPWSLQSLVLSLVLSLLSVIVGCPSLQEDVCATLIAGSGRADVGPWGRGASILERMLTPDWN